MFLTLWSLLAQGVHTVQGGGCLPRSRQPSLLLPTSPAGKRPEGKGDSFQGGRWQYRPDELKTHEQIETKVRRQNSRFLGCPSRHLSWQRCGWSWALAHFPTDRLLVTWNDP